MRPDDRIRRSTPCQARRAVPLRLRMPLPILPKSVKLLVSLVTVAGAIGTPASCRAGESGAKASERSKIVVSPEHVELEGHFARAQLVVSVADAVGKADPRSAD